MPIQKITSTDIATNTSITGSQISANTVTSTNLQTGSVENYMSSQGLALGMRNRIINGDMRIDQRNAGGSVSTGSGTNVYTLDRWRAIYSQQNKYTVQQNANAVTPPAGYTKYLGVVSSSAYTVGASETFRLLQYIEGLNCSDLNWGSASAATVTLSFWVRSSLTGTFGGAISNDSSNRSYPFSYSISSANTWEQKTITIPGDTTGTWLTTNGRGIEVTFSLGTGSIYSASAGSWAAGEYVSATGATSVVGTNGATFYITGVQIEKGATATPFENRLYGTELALCQRYYEQSWASGTPAGTSTNTNIVWWYAQNSGNWNNAINYYKVTKRSSPTVTTYSSSGTSGKMTNLDSFTEVTSRIVGSGTNNFMVSTDGIAIGQGVGLGFHYTSSSEL